MEERVMAYKAVSTNESHIAHANRPRMAYQYVPTHNGIGNPHHGFSGQFTFNPAGRADQGHTGEGGDGYHYAKNTTDWDAKPVGGDVNNYHSDSSDYDTSRPKAEPEPETFKNSDYYRYQNAKNLTDEQLAEANLRAIRESNYNKNYPSRSEEFMKGAQQANQLVNQGAAFTKSLMPDKIYAAPLDLSNMTDEQLRAANNRAQLEMQYNQYFNPPKQNDAKKWVDIAATGMGLAISAAGVAVPIVIEVMRNKKKGG